MDHNLQQEIQEALSERADIEKLMAERDKKDRRIISKFCAENTAADIGHIIELLRKYNGLSGDDEETVNMFSEAYPKKLTLKLIYEFIDVKDIYSAYLESGGEE